MYISRDFLKRPVTDFMTNIRPKLNDTLIAEEVYEGNILVGWNIVELIKKN
jgi:hypothetical protein